MRVLRGSTNDGYLIAIKEKIKLRGVRAGKKPAQGEGVSKYWTFWSPSPSTRIILKPSAMLRPPSTATENTSISSNDTLHKETSPILKK
jgi:hypothetical protein